MSNNRIWISSWWCSCFCASHVIYAFYIVTLSYRTNGKRWKERGAMGAVQSREAESNSLWILCQRRRKVLAVNGLFSYLKLSCCQPIFRDFFYEIIDFGGLPKFGCLCNFAILMRPRPSERRTSQSYGVVAIKLGFYALHASVFPIN